MNKLALTAAFLLAFSAAPAMAQGKETLRGVAGVRVGVAVVGDGAQDGVPGEAALRVILEERARAAGLQLNDSDRAPRLHLVVNVQKYAAEGVYAVAVDLDLYQLVSLERVTAPPFHASTWRVTQVLLRPAGELGSVREVVERAADSFVKDYHSVNAGRR